MPFSDNGQEKKRFGNVFAITFTLTLALSHQGRGKKRKGGPLLRVFNNLVLAEAEARCFPHVDVFAKQQERQEWFQISLKGD